MADFIFNISKGRAVEFQIRVDNNDPTDAALYVIPVDANGVSDATARDVDTFAALITAGFIERNTNGWNRKTISDADVSAPAPDDTNDRFDLVIADQTWDPGPTSGNVTDLVICFGSVASPTNSQLTPVSCHDFAITPDGSVVVADVPSAGWYRAA